MKHLILVGIIVLVMGGGGVLHLIAPEYFEAFVFNPLPKTLTVLTAGIVQIAIAALVLIPSTRALGGVVFALLCLGYMPLHVWDLFRPDPVIAPLSVAVIRVVIQAGFIWVGWKIWHSRRI
ncbi:MAG: hypothetical protein OXC62_04910 [Aestuariivita sp.]|nr:hypothetical protein [Aestuariivita sp.]